MHGGVPQLSVVIPSCGRPRRLEETVRLLLRQDALPYEIILVVQGIAGGVAVHDSRLRLIHLPRPNLPAARNAGIDIARAELVLFLDDDIIPDENLLRAHVEAHQRWPQVQAVVGRVRDARCDGSRPQLVIFNPDTNEYVVDFARVHREECLSMAGGNTSLKRGVFARVRFDPLFFGNAHWEEVDVAFRMRACGMPILFEPAAALTHLMEGTGGCRRDGPFVDTIADFSNTTLFYLKHGNWRAARRFIVKQVRHLEYLSRVGRCTRSMRIVVAGVLGVICGAALYLFEMCVRRDRLPQRRFAQVASRLLP